MHAFRSGESKQSQLIPRSLRFSRKSQNETETTEKVQRKGLLGKLGLKKKVKGKAAEEPVEEQAPEEAPATEDPVDPEPANEGEDARETEAKEEAPVDAEPTEGEAAKGEEAREQPESVKSPTGESAGMFCGCL